MGHKKSPSSGRYKRKQKPINQKKGLAMNQLKTSATDERNLNNVIKIDSRQIQSHLGEMVRGTVEETLNGLLDAEADQLCNAQRYERTAARSDNPFLEKAMLFDGYPIDPDISNG